MSDDPKDIKKPESDALAMARKQLASIEIKVLGSHMSPEGAGLVIASAQAQAQVAIAERLDTLSNDVAAIANMMADFLQEREAEANRQVAGNN